MHLYSHTDKIWTIANFLTESACEELIHWSEARGYKEATVSLPEGAKMMKGLRNNYRVNFQDAKYAQTLFKHLKEYLPILDQKYLPAALNDMFRFYRYDTYQKFKRHIDGRVKTKNLESRLNCMVYLNSNFTGGETKFDEISISPETGKCLLFIHEQKHESLPILTGTKYVLRSDILYKIVHGGEAQ